MRPHLIAFAFLIAKRTSFIECINVVEDSKDWKDLEANKKQVSNWFKENKVKAFYSVLRSTDFDSGGRAALEMSGLGKLRPNLLLIGFKSDWQTGNTKDGPCTLLPRLSVSHLQVLSIVEVS